MYKFFLLFFILINSLFAKNITTVSEYISYTTYSNSVKKEDYTSGIYSSFYHYPNKFELDIAHTLMKFNYNYPKLNQNDFTAIYSRFLNKNYTIKSGLHYISGNDKLTDKGTVAILGINYGNIGYNLGLDFYYSRYKNYKPKKLKIYQIHPYTSINLGKLNKKLNNFSLEAEFNHIHPINGSKYYLYSSYNYYGLKLNRNFGKFNASIGGWKGKKNFAVDNGGFSVYNLNKLYTKGVLTSIDYSIRPNMHLKLNYSYNKFNEYYNKKGHSNSTSLLFSHSW